MMFLTLIIFYFIATDCIDANRIGIIYNASLNLSTSSISIIEQGSTCNECLCIGFNEARNNSILSLNCYTNNSNYVSCQMFTIDMYLRSLFFQMVNDSKSTFYFKQLPSFINQSTVTVATDITSKYFLFQK